MRVEAIKVQITGHRLISAQFDAVKNCVKDNLFM